MLTALFSRTFGSQWQIKISLQHICFFSHVLFQWNCSWLRTVILHLMLGCHLQKSNQSKKNVEVTRKSCQRNAILEKDFPLVRFRGIYGATVWNRERLRACSRSKNSATNQKPGLQSRDHGRSMEQVWTWGGGGNQRFLLKEYQLKIILKCIWGGGVGGPKKILWAAPYPLCTHSVPGAYLLTITLKITLHTNCVCSPYNSVQLRTHSVLTPYLVRTKITWL